MAHPLYFGGEQLSSSGGESIRLPVARSLALADSPDRAFGQQPAKSSVQRASTQPDATARQSFNILQDGVAVPRLGCEARKDEEDRLRHWLIARDDMSH